MEPQFFPSLRGKEVMRRMIPMFKTKTNAVVSRSLSVGRWAGSTFLFLGLVALSACSSGNAWRPTVEGITLTDIDGTPLKTQPASLTVGQGTYIGATLRGDSQLLGVDWTAVCGSALPPGTPLPPGQPQDESCGTFTPAHTLSGPIPAYVTNAATSGYVALYVAPVSPPKQGVVTLYALATADHSRVATVTLSIEGQPISVAFAPAPPTTMQAGASAQFKAALNSDVNNAGVRWSVICGSTDCGSFGPVETVSGVATTYLAPATVPSAGYVEVTATSVADPTKAVSAKISITP